MALSMRLAEDEATRWFAWCLARYHQAAFQQLDDRQVQALAGAGLRDKAMVDTYARVLVGPAWVQGLVSDGMIQRWAGSDDPSWRRAALISTIALNTRGDGGHGDIDRTLAVCSALAKDRHPLVAQALAQALRALARWQPGAAEAFRQT